MQVCPVGQVAPMQSSMQLPATQCVPIAHCLPTHVDSTQRPLIVSHALPPLHGRQLQLVVQMPASQTEPCAHVTPAHGSTHAPDCDDTVRDRGSSLHHKARTRPCSQTLARGARNGRARGIDADPVAAANLARRAGELAARARHHARTLVADVAVGQRFVPSSTMPLQSSSRPLHVSVPGWLSCWQMTPFGVR